MVQEELLDGRPQQEADKKGRRGRSEIEFPYSDLEAAVDLARTLLDHTGSSCEDAELAAWLNQSPNSGTYRARRSAARMFGLVTVAQARLTLTTLGRRILDNTDSRAARIEAFLKPALFAAMYDQHRDQILPPPAAIERQMEQLGVSPKQKHRARQVFQKSAQYAGFIDAGTGRFIRPGSGSAAERPPPRERRGGGGGSGGGDDNAQPEIDPIIRGLLARLPKAGEVWPEAERKLWLQLLEGSFKLIYKDTNDAESLDS